MASKTTFDAQTSALEVAATFASRVRDKIVLITGVSKDGIGEAIARAFAHGGASTIIVTGRDDSRLSSIVNDLTADYPAVKFQPHKLNLTSLQASRQSAERILQDDTVPKIDIVVANAGGTFHGPRTVTDDGLETHLAVNHLGHFVFITTLLPKLRLAAQSSALGETRVVVLSSLALYVSPFRFADWNLDGKPVPEEEATNWGILKQLLGLEEHEGYDAEVAYGQSKTANVLFAVHWNTLFSDEGIFAFALHPGGVQSRAAKKVLGAMTEEQRAKLTIPFNKSIDQGAATPLVAALDPGLTPEKGTFLNDCQIMTLPPYADSKENAEKLWRLSEDIVAQKLKLAA